MIAFWVLVVASKVAGASAESGSRSRCCGCYVSQPCRYFDASGEIEAVDAKASWASACLAGVLRSGWRKSNMNRTSRFLVVRRRTGVKLLPLPYLDCLDVSEARPCA